MGALQDDRRGAPEMNMIERVARQMAAADSGPEGSEIFNIHWSEFDENYRNGARAAIEAMRSHTKDMDSAGYDAYPGDDHLDIYRAMIDAALREND